MRYSEFHQNHDEVEWSTWLIKLLMLVLLLLLLCSELKRNHRIANGSFIMVFTNLCVHNFYEFFHVIDNSSVQSLCVSVIFGNFCFFFLSHGSNLIETKEQKNPDWQRRQPMKLCKQTSNLMLSLKYSVGFSVYFSSAWHRQSDGSLSHERPHHLHEK